jgi:ABC-type Fe3+ transport system permease subunit
MFPQLKKINNESGVVLFIVLMTAIIIMLFSVGILTQSLNESSSAQQQVDQIVSDQLSKGFFWNAFANGTLGATAPANIGVSTITLQGRIYTMSLNWYGSPGGIANWIATANYDTFQ